MSTATQETEIKRITVFTANTFERELYAKAAECGVLSYVCMYCSGRGLADPCESGRAVVPLVRVEVLAKPEAAERLIAFLRLHRGGPVPVTATVDSVCLP